MRGIRKVMGFILLLSVFLCASAAALANDEELASALPGTWIYSVDSEEDTPSQALLTLGKDGSMVLLGQGENGYTYEGTWSLELVDEPSPEYGYNDRLTLTFTGTDDPAFGEGYHGECVYYVYAESWVENSTRYTYLLNTGSEGREGSPFEKLCSEEGAAVLHREEGANMKVINCKQYVSLRQEPLQSAVRLKKVSLGASVFVFPECEEENGFRWCVFGDEYGYILSEYLQPI